MNTITFVSSYATGEKNDDVVFYCFQPRFLATKIKKTKIIQAFFTILSKILLPKKKRARKAPRTFCEKRNENLLLKSSVRNHEMKFLRNTTYFFLSGKFFSSYLVLYFGRKRSLASFCLYLLVRRKRCCPIVFF